MSNTNINDLKLQLALAKILPEILIICPDEITVRWRSILSSPQVVQDTEWLHVCWLVEQALSYDDKINQYVRLVEVSSSWQRRAEALCKVKGIKV